MATKLDTSWSIEASSSFEPLRLVGDDTVAFRFPDQLPKPEHRSHPVQRERSRVSNDLKESHTIATWVSQCQKLIEQRIHHSQLHAPVIPTIRTVPCLLDSVEAFKPNAQAPAQLPNNVGASIMARFIKCRSLSRSSVEIHITIGDGGAELLVPT